MPWLQLTCKIKMLENVYFACNHVLSSPRVQRAIFCKICATFCFMCNYGFRHNKINGTVSEREEGDCHEGILTGEGKCPVSEIHIAWSFVSCQTSSPS